MVWRERTIKGGYEILENAGYGALLHIELSLRQVCARDRGFGRRGIPAGTLLAGETVPSSSRVL